VFPARTSQVRWRHNVWTPHLGCRSSSFYALATWTGRGSRVLLSSNKRHIIWPCIKP
jgi:hypothetical protein